MAICNNSEYGMDLYIDFILKEIIKVIFKDIMILI